MCRQKTSLSLPSEDLAEEVHRLSAAFLPSPEDSPDLAALARDAAASVQRVALMVRTRLSTEDDICPLLSLLLLFFFAFAEAGVNMLPLCAWNWPSTSDFGVGFV